MIPGCSLAAQDAKGGATSAQVIADFLGSREYFQGNNANAGDWLSSVYQKVLSRSPDQSGYDGWLAARSGKHV